MMNDFGVVKIHLAELLEKSGMSKNKFCNLAQMQRSQVKNYCNNTVSRVDLELVARICAVLKCDITDLLEYIPAEDK